MWDCRTGCLLPDSLLDALEAGGVKRVSVIASKLEDINWIHTVSAGDQNYLWGSLFDAPKAMRLPLAQLLFERGADLNYTGYDGASPLWLAHLWGPPEVFDFLLSNGADPNVICFPDERRATLLDFVRAELAGARQELTRLPEHAREGWHRSVAQLEQLAARLVLLGATYADGDV